MKYPVKSEGGPARRNLSTRSTLHGSLHEAGEHPTSNIELPTSNGSLGGTHWVFDVLRFRSIRATTGLALLCLVTTSRVWAAGSIDDLTGP